MFKRVTIVALVVAAFLVLAVPALAFNGYRGDYTVKEGCACHDNALGSVPPITPAWGGSKHAVAGADDQALRLPYGSVCAGCHTSNFDPTKVVPTPTATATDGTVSWGAANGIPDPLTQSTGEFASSENFVGCSSCHYGTNALGALFGEDSNDTAHKAPYGELANADICGACHSRYSYTTDTFPVSPIPAATPTTLIQPQMAIGYPMLGSPAPSPSTGWDPAAPLADYLVVPQPGWTPMPDPSATSAAGLMTYWQIDGKDTMWQAKGHDGGAAQYPEWKSEGHAQSLTALTSQPFWASFPEATKQQCLECHSADYRIMEDRAAQTGKPGPTSADVKYGITCVGCHTPHDAGTTKGAWDEEFDAQLIGNPKNPSDLCVTCHNGEIPEGQQATPGTEVHHPMKEMMAGYGAIGVDEIPSVHEGECVKCHMPPTSWSRGSVQLGGNHTFTIIEPEVAAEASADIGSGTVIDGMPFSACTTCHGGNAPNDPEATYLQPRIEQRQAWTKAKIEAIWTELDMAAVKLGYADADAAHTALVGDPRERLDQQPAPLPQLLHERRVRGQRGQLRPPQLGLLEPHRQHGDEPGEGRCRAGASQVDHQPSRVEERDQEGSEDLLPRRRPDRMGRRGERQGQPAAQDGRSELAELEVADPCQQRLVQDRAEAQLQEGQVVLPYRHARRRWPQPQEQQPQLCHQDQVGSLPASRPRRPSDDRQANEGRPPRGGRPSSLRDPARRVSWSRPAHHQSLASCRFGCRNG